MKGDLIIIFGYVFSLLCLVCAVWQSYDTFLNYRRAKQSRHWPTTKGRVNVCEIRNEYAGQWMRSYTCQVHYAYAVNGQTYNAKRVSFNEDIYSKTERMAYEIANSYPVGSEVRVHYHPKYPQLATLKIEAVSGGNILLTVCISCLLIFPMGWILYQGGLAI